MGAKEVEIVVWGWHMLRKWAQIPPVTGVKILRGTERKKELGEDPGKASLRVRVLSTDCAPGTEFMLHADVAFHLHPKPLQSRL